MIRVRLPVSCLAASLTLVCSGWAQQPAYGSPAPADDVPAALAAPAEGTPGLDLERLRRRWEGAMESFHVPGCSVAIVKDGQTHALLGMGQRDEAGRPVDADTFFYIASATKPFLGAAVVALAEDGQLDLDAPVKEAWPAFTLADRELIGTITPRDLLAHKPGINSGDIVFLDAYTGDITEERYVELLGEVWPSGEVDYTNVHFTILGRVVEALSGKSWKDHLQTELFDVLGLSRTTAYASRMYGDDNVAFPMVDGPEGGFVHSRVRKTDRVMHAAGGMGTTARDAARWIAANLPGGALQTSGLMSAEARADMQRLHGATPPNGQIRRMEGYGLAWFVGTFRGRPYRVHGGGYVGTAAHISFLPEHGYGVAVLANASPGGQMLCDIVSIDVYDALLGETDQPDLLPHYERRAADRGFAPQQPRVAMVEEHLTRDPDVYVGSFEHVEWGQLHISRSEDGLYARLGDLLLDMEAKWDDRFRATAAGGSIWFEGEFPKGEGTVQSVHLWDDENDVYLTRVE